MRDVEQARSAASLESMVSAWALGAALAACGAQPSAPQDQLQALIGGEPAPSQSSTVLVSHRDVGLTCSGALIGRRLVVTALHCLYDARGALPLAVDGLRVGFGVVRDQGPSVGVERIEAVDPVPVDLGASVDGGRDVALLWLAADGPPDVEPLAVALDYAPRLRDAFYLSGYGLSSTAGTNGTRLRAAATLSGEDAATGLLELSGATPCYGDSGGPAVLQRRNALVGVLGQFVAGSGADTCDTALAFIYSTRNPDIRALLERGCARAGGCGPRSDSRANAGDDAGAIAESDGGTERVQDAGRHAAEDGGVRDAMHDAGWLPHSASDALPAEDCGCRALGTRAGDRHAKITWGIFVLGVAGGLRRRRLA